MPTATKIRQPELFQDTNVRQKPFLKWAGGKYRVLGEILHRLPAGDRLIEPFAGSAAVSLNAEFAAKRVVDANADLINLYSSIKANPDKFICEASSLFASKFNERDEFNRLRTEFNESQDPFRRSVIFVYLNRHAFNGLCRYNSKGQFNVPFGKYKNPGFPLLEIEAFAVASRNMEFEHRDFSVTMEQAVEGDVIYCDPPYVPLSSTSNFTSYAPGSFGLTEQKTLADLARKCAGRGVPVVISNHHTSESEALYEGAELHTFEVRRFISSKASTRGNAPELLAIFR